MDLEEFWIKNIQSDYIGDDGAVIGENVYAMDAFWEGTHFKREWMSAKQIAYKSFMVNLSDMVAMNAQASFMMLTLAIPQDISQDFLLELSDEFNYLAKKHNIAIIGGDTIGSDKLGISIAMIGNSKEPLFRKGVQNEHLLAYTGELGEVKRDLEKLFNGEKIASNSKFYKPMLRSNFIKKARPFLSAGMDISDGLYCDTNKLLKANNLFLQELLVIPKEIGDSGEEYEMLIAFDVANLSAIKTIAKLTQTPLTIFAKASKEENKFYPCKSHHF